jgi:hypothetical protein
MRKLISLLVLISLHTCTPVYAQESGVIVSGVSTTLRSNKGPLTLETAESKPINFVFGSGTASPVTLSLSETGALTGLTSSTFTTLTGTATASAIKTDTADAADSKQLSIAGGGTAAASRGAYANFAGNESAGGGELALVAGNAGGGRIALFTSAYPVEILTNSLLRWSFGSTGNLTQDATNGGNIIMAIRTIRPLEQVRQMGQIT